MLEELVALVVVSVNIDLRCPGKDQGTASAFRTVRLWMKGGQEKMVAVWLMVL